MRIVWLRAEVVRMVIAVMQVLNRRPVGRVALGRRKVGAQPRPPLRLVAGIERPRPLCPNPLLCEQLRHELPVHVRQAEVTPLEAIRQLLVIDAEQP